MDLRLPVERPMIGIFGPGIWVMVDSVGGPPSISWAGASACMTPSSRRGAFGAPGDDIAELRRHHAQPFAPAFIDPMKFASSRGRAQDLQAAMAGR